MRGALGAASLGPRRSESALVGAVTSSPLVERSAAEGGVVTSKGANSADRVNNGSVVRSATGVTTIPMA